MKTGIKVLIGALAFVVSNAYAAEFMTKVLPTDKAGE